MAWFKEGDEVIYTRSNPRRGQAKTESAIVQKVVNDDDIAIAFDGGTGTVLWVSGDDLRTVEEED
jgi:hypothetical protein